MSRSSNMLKILVLLIVTLAIVFYILNLEGIEMDLVIIVLGIIFIIFYLLYNKKRRKRVKYKSNGVSKKKLALILTVSFIIALVGTYFISQVPLLLDSFSSEHYSKIDITKNTELIETLQEQDGNVILAMHGYDHQNPDTGTFSNEFLGLTTEEIHERIDNGYSIFQENNLNPTAFIPPGGKYGDELKEVLSEYNLTIIDYGHGEYTFLWRDMESFTDPRFKDAWHSLDSDKPDTLLLHIQDYNQYTEMLLDNYIDNSDSEIILRVDDINVQTPNERLEAVLELGEKYDLELILGVTPRFYEREEYSEIFVRAQLTSWGFFLVLVVFSNIFFACLSTIHLSQINKNGKKVYTNGGNLPKVSVIIPMFNEEKTVKKTMHHALKQTYKGPIEIIAVDDGSTDNTFKILSKFLKENKKTKPKNRVIKLIRQENKGKPEALNNAHKISTGKIIVSTDGDSFLRKDAIDIITQRFFQDPEVGAVSGLVVALNESESWTTKFSQIEYIKEQVLFRGCQSLTGDVVICPGAFFAVRRFALENNPSKDRTVVEDCDQTCLIRKSGWKIVFEPKAISETRAPARMKSWINQRIRWFYGYLQVWNILKRFCIKKPWMIYAYLGYPLTFITFLILGIPLLFSILFPLPSYFLIDMIIYYLFGMSISFGIYLYTIYVLSPTKIKRSTLPWMALFPFYEIIIAVMRAYLYVLYISGRGPTMKYGPKYLRALPNGTIKFTKKS